MEILTYIKSMEHNYNNATTFIEKVENLMNIKSNYLCINNKNKDEITILDWISIINIFDSNIDVYSKN